jgi:hypothetical protein
VIILKFLSFMIWPKGTWSNHKKIWNHLKIKKEIKNGSRIPFS